MQREVIKWLQSLDLSTPVQNPKRDLINGRVVAEVVVHYGKQEEPINLDRLPRGASPQTNRDIWRQVFRVLQQEGCTTVTRELVEAVLRRQPNAAIAVLENLYEFYTGNTLAMRGLDARWTARDQYVQPKVLPPTTQLLRAAGEPAAVPEQALAASATSAERTAVASTSTRPKSAARGSSAVLTRKDPLPLLSPSTATDVISEGGLGGEEEAAAAAAAAAAATRAVQTHLALTDNDELAGGAPALKVQPRYCQPTASSLVHTANSQRKEVDLERAKYATDEVARQHGNARLVAQHGVVNRVREERRLAALGRRGGGGGGATWPSGRLGDAGDAGVEHSPLPGTLDGREGSSGSGWIADGTPSLTTIYRGTHYLSPLPHKKGAKATGGRQEAHRKSAPSQGTGAVSPATPDNMGTMSSHVSAGSEEQSREQPRIKKINVDVCNGTLRAALSATNHYTTEQQQQRANALSVRLFEKHGWIIRPAVNELLVDILASQRELQLLVDHCNHGNAEVLFDILGHVMAHRDLLHLDTIHSCWMALGQHISGISAALNHRPDQMDYLLESFSFAFTYEAAQVALLHVSAPADSGASVGGEESTLRQDTAAGSGRVAVHKSRAGVSSAPGMAEAPLPLPSRGHAPSIADALLSAARRISLSARKASRGGLMADAETERQTAIVNHRFALHVTSVFAFLCNVVEYVQVDIAAALLQEYLLPVVAPTLVRHGRPAVVEAVGRIISSCFVARSGSSSISNNGTLTSSMPLREMVEEDIADVEARCWRLAAFLTEQLPQLLGRGAMEPGRRRCGTTDYPWALLTLHTLAAFPSKESSGEAMALATAAVEAGMVCLTHVDATMRTIGLGLTLELSSWSLPVALFSQLLRCVWRLCDTDRSGPGGCADSSGVVEGGSVLAPWLCQRDSASWESRLIALQLFTTLLQLAELESEQGEEGATYCVPWETASLDAAAAACLETFAMAPTWQRHLALSAASRHLRPEKQPELARRWTKLLQSLPAEVLRQSLLAYHTDAPAKMMLGSSMMSKVDNIGSMELPVALGKTFPASFLMSGSAAPDSAVETAAVPSPSRSDGETMQLIAGRVASSYVLCPLNQLWNAYGVVRAVVSCSDPPVNPQVLFLVVGAALLTPKGGALPPNCSTVPRRSSTMISELTSDHGPSEREFWLATLQQLWPIFTQCGVENTEGSDAEDVMASNDRPPALEGGDTTLIQSSDVAAILLTLFQRYAGDACLATATTAAAEDWSKMLSSAARWGAAVYRGDIL